MNNVYGVIYKIRNKVNNKLYIGQTTRDFDSRYRNNIYKNTHNFNLKKEIDKFGIDSFEVDKEFDLAYSQKELDDLESMYIKIYNTTDSKFGYNKTINYKSILKKRENKVNLRNSAIENRGKYIVCLDTKEIFPSISKAVERYPDISYDNLANYLNGSIGYTTSVIYEWDTVENVLYGLDEAFGFTIDFDTYFKQKIKESIYDDNICVFGE